MVWSDLLEIVDNVGVPTIGLGLFIFIIIGILGFAMLRASSTASFQFSDWIIFMFGVIPALWSINSFIIPAVLIGILVITLAFAVLTSIKVESSVLNSLKGLKK